MYFTEKEKSIMNPLDNIIFDNSNKAFRMILQDDTEVIVSFDTDYDTDNNLETEEEGYEEFHGYAFEVIKVICRGNEFNRHQGDLFEITYHNYPKKIEVIDLDKLI